MPGFIDQDNEPIIIELNNEQTQNLLSAVDVATGLGGLASSLDPICIGLLTTWITWNKSRVARANKGNGVIIRMPAARILLDLVVGSFFISVKPRL